MRRVLRKLRALGVGLSLLACGRGDAPPPPDRPSLPTLALAPRPDAPTSGRRVVAFGQIAQPWHVGAWAPASITLTDVAAGDAIVVLGAYWGDLVARSSTAPTDLQGTLTRVIDQGSSIVGRKKPPVFAQLYVELDAAPGPHTIVPPYLGGPAGDGTMYVVQLRGLTEHRVITVGQRWTAGSALTGASVALEGDAAADDLLLAIGAYDNTAQRDSPGWTPAPPGWTSLGSQDDAANNVPSSARVRAAAQTVRQASWGWADPTVNVTVAVIAAIR